MESLQVPEASCSPIQLTPGTSEAPVPHHGQSSGDTPSQTFPSLLMKADLTTAKHRSFPPPGLCIRYSLCLQMPVWLAHPSFEWRLISVPQGSFPIVVFPTFFNLSLNLAIRGSWSEPQSAPGLVFAKPRRDASAWGEERGASGARQQQGPESCFLEAPEDVSGSWWK